MKLSLSRARKLTLCSFARNICGNTRAHLPILELKDIRVLCQTVSYFCEEHGCGKAAKNCLQAVLKESEEEFLKSCMKSCELCSLVSGKKKSSQGKELLIV